MTVKLEDAISTLRALVAAIETGELRAPRLLVARLEGAIVALEALAIIEELLPAIQRVGGYFHLKLNELARKHSFVKEVRGFGLMIGVELTVPGKQIVDPEFDAAIPFAMPQQPEAEARVFIHRIVGVLQNVIDVPFSCYQSIAIGQRNRRAGSLAGGAALRCGGIGHQMTLRRLMTFMAVLAVVSPRFFSQ